MRWLSTCLFICAWTTLVASVTPVPDLHCNHPQCVDDGYDALNNFHTFTVEGHKIYIKYLVGKPNILYCHKWQALDSPALPRSLSGIIVTYIELAACPLPTNSSIVDALAAMNITLQNGDKTTLKITDLPAEPQLSQRHFQGFENITDLKITTTLLGVHTPDLSFLAKLQNLRYLNLDGMPLPADVPLPPTIRHLRLHLDSKTVRSLSDILRQTSNDRSDKSVPSNAKDTDAQETKSSTLEELVLIDWKEQRLVPLDGCDNLKRIELIVPTLEELPNRWVSACSHLEEIAIHGAKNLNSLPPKLLEGAIALKKLAINGILQSLPNGLLEGAPNLIELDVTANDLRTISSGAFAGPALQILRVGHNELENLEGITSLTSLKVLSIDHNPLGDLCDRDGYSILKNLTQLEELILRALNITHTCKDWRENMMLLKDLHLERTQITELGFTDLIYKRDATVKNVSLYLYFTPLKTVRLTEDDYKKAIANPPETTILLRTIQNRFLKCDCDMFWTWKALTGVNTPWLELNCEDNLLLHTKSGIEICPERFSYKF